MVCGILGHLKKEPGMKGGKEVKEGMGLMNKGSYGRVVYINNC